MTQYKHIPLKCKCGGEFITQFYTRYGKIWPPVESVLIDKDNNITSPNNQYLQCNSCGETIEGDKVDSFITGYFKNEEN